MKFAWIREHRCEFPVDAMCRVLAVSRSGFYAWLRRPPCKRAERGKALAKMVGEVFDEFDERYGSPRIVRELRKRGESVSENTVARRMREEGIRAKAARRFVPQTTDSEHGLPVAENRLARDFSATEPNRKWVTDITYIETGEGWLYLSAVLDLFSRMIVGWSMADHMRTEMTLDSLSMAVTRRKPEAGLLHHSDRGSQYASREYQDLLAANGCVCSMSRAGNCYDNAAMESFWGTLKSELVYCGKFATRAEARAAIFEYIEVFYNRKRMHSSLGYVSPEEFEAALN